MWLFANADTTTKVVKRGRVPKGFLSSNTAYMLVYKRLTAENKQPSSGKRGRLKKHHDGEINNAGNTVQLERLTVGDRAIESQMSSDEGMDKNLTEASSSVANSNSCSASSASCGSNSSRCSPSSVKKTHLDGENSTMEVDEGQAPEQKPVMNGIADYHDEDPMSVEETDDEKKSNIEQTADIAKNVKIEYRLLNGDAHRNMSCGERDIYEDVSHAVDSFFFLPPKPSKDH